jgi:hypothetical protein
MAEHAAREIPVPDNGDLDAGLALARQVVASLRNPVIRAAFTAIAAAAIQDPAARELLSRFIGSRVATMTAMVRRAVTRGGLSAGTR